MSVIRAIIQSIADVTGQVRRFTASGRPDETITNREMFQDYGFASNPQPGAEGIVINDGNHYIMIATEDRRYRIPLQTGEVALYTDEGDTIKLGRGHQITINTTGTVVIGDSSALALLTSAFATLYNGHTHDPNTGMPVQQAGSAQETSKVRGT